MEQNDSSQSAPAPSDKPVTRRDRVIAAVALTVSVCLGYGAIYRVNPRFFYQDDSEGVSGIWWAIGACLRRGVFPLLRPEEWMSGNYPAEGYGLWNPGQLAVSWLAPSFDDVSLFNLVLKLGFALILASGIYRVSREYGASPLAAAVAGAAIPFSGFSLYFDQASWTTGFIASAWVAQSWASTARYARGRSGPLGAFITLYLAISVGYAHAAVMAGLMVGCVVVGEAWPGRNLGGALKAALVAVAAALCGLMTFLPSFLTSPVTWRAVKESLVGAYGYMSVPWSESLVLSLPSQLPAVRGFAGTLHPVPITYVAWFVLPALAFVDWPAALNKLRGLAAPLTVLVCLLLLTAGPANIGPLRWPARLLPYFAMPVLVLVAVLISRHAACSHLRRRLVAAGLLLVVAGLRAATITPELGMRHLIAALLVLAVTCIVLAVARWRGQRVAFLVAGGCTVLVLAVQMSWFPNNPGVRQWSLPTSRSEAIRDFPDHPGTTFQVGQYATQLGGGRSAKDTWSNLVFGNYAHILGLRYVNNYTPIGFSAFSSLFCTAYDGSTCPEARGRLFSTEPTTGTRYVDLLAVDRVVLQRLQHPNAAQEPPPKGWFVSHEGTDSITLERDRPMRRKGHVVATLDAEVDRVLKTSDTRDELKVSSQNGGRLVFARLAWPGYTARLDGLPLPVNSVGGIFVAVDIPAGTSEAKLALSFLPPGIKLGIACAMAGLALLVGLLVGPRFGRRWRERKAALPAT